MEDVEITDNMAFGEEVGGVGGGARIQLTTVEMTRVLFRNNWARVSGGAVSFHSDSHANITACSFIDNTADLHGGAFSADGHFSDIRVSSTSIERNSAFEGEGGCIHLTDTATLTLTNVDVKTCTAGRNGGGVSLRGESSLMLENDITIRDCEATRGMGGGLLAAGDSVTFKGDINKRVLVEKNRAKFGGGISCMSHIALEGHSTSLIQNNEARQDGGGLFGFSSYAELIVGPNHRLVFQNNVAGGDGGGICIKQGAQLSVQPPACSSSCASHMRGNGLCDHP